MLTIQTNQKGRLLTRPVFKDIESVMRFVTTAYIPEDAEFLPVPSVVAVTHKSFWVQPESSPYPGVSSFLINPDMMQPVTLTGSNDQTPLVCYVVNERLVIGRVDEDGQDKFLRPIIAGLHHPVDVSKARCLGRAEAAM